MFKVIYNEWVATTIYYPFLVRKYANFQADKHTCLIHQKLVHTIQKYKNILGF